MNLRQHHARPKVGDEPFDMQMDRLNDLRGLVGDGLRDIEPDDLDAVKELVNRYHEVIAIARELVAEGNLAVRAILVTDERP